MHALFFLFPPGSHDVSLLLEVREFFAELFQAGPARRVLFFFQRRLLDLELHDLSRDLVELCGHGVDLGAHHGARLIHQIDSLVRKKPVRDIAVRQHCGRHQGAVLDFHAVMHLVALLEPPQDGDRVFDRRGVDHDRLEPPLQGRIFLDVLAVLVQGCGPQAVQLSPGQHGLEHVARVHGAFRAPGAHDVVDLVDEEQDPSLTRLDLAQYSLEPLFELSSELGSGNERPHVQGKDSLVLQAFGHVAPHDPLCKAFDDGGLAYSGLADENGVVFGLPGENTYGAAYFRIPADDRVELAELSLGHEVDPILFKRFIRRLRIVAGYPLIAADGGESLKDPLFRHIELGKYPSRRGFSALFHHGEQQVFHGYVLVLQPGRLFFGPHQHLVEPLSDVDLACLGAGPRYPGPAFELLVHFGDNRVHRDIHFGQNSRYQSVGLLQQGHEHVLDIELNLLETRRDVLGVLDRLLGFLCQLIHIHLSAFPPRACFA